MTRGFILVEAAVSYVILAVAVTALVPMFIVALRASKQTEKAQVSADLSTELLEEVRLRRWDENTPLATVYISTPSTTLGVDAGESAADKTTFDDIDDFNGWSERGVRDPMNRAVPGFDAYTRTVTVSYVSSSFTVTGSTTDFKRVQVCTTSFGSPSFCLTTLRTNR